jgi:pilus assembly protein CpaB
MKPKQLLAVGISGIVSLGAFYAAMNLSAPAPTEKIVETQVNTTEVLVARDEIGLGQIVSPENFRWQAWPKDAVTQAYIQKASKPNAVKDLSGAVARAPLLKGEPITPVKLVKAGDGGVLAAILPPGMRAISTRIKEETGVSKLILPNDHVDVILIQRKRGKSGSEDFVADTLFRNVRVLSIGQIIEAKDGKKVAEGNTATLELTPRQSELLALANSMGEISLALRSVADMNPNTGPSAGNGLSQRSNSIRVLRYGVKSRAYGVN